MPDTCLTFFTMRHGFREAGVLISCWRPAATCPPCYRPPPFPPAKGDTRRLTRQHSPPPLHTS